MPLLKGKKNIGRNITELEEHGSRPRSHKQILAIALHEGLDKKAMGGGIAKLASGGVGGSAGGLAASPFAGDQAPAVTINQPQGLSGALPQSQGIPIGLQLAAIKAMTKADADVRGNSQNNNNSAATDQQMMRMMQQQPQATQGMSKGGVFGVLNAKPPRSLARVTEPQVTSGFLHSTIPGRTDRLATSVRAGSHIIPADVVSSFGQGNSLAGARNLDTTMRALPSAFAKGGRTTKSAPPSPPLSGQDDHQPVMLAGGEYVVGPEEVRAIGEGDQKKGHDILDKMIVRVRRKEAHKMLKLPGPKK